MSVRQKSKNLIDKHINNTTRKELEKQVVAAKLAATT